MDNNNLLNYKLIVMMMLIILFYVSPIVALGVTPGRTTLDFAPNLERDVEFSILNTEKKDMNAAFSVEGDLKDYVTIDADVVSFSSTEESKSFKYKLRLPNGLSPGLHTADIITLELPPETNDPGMVIKATVSVVTQWYVYVPYPGKYIESSLDIVTKEETNVVNFYLPFISRGDESIASVKSIIDIYKGSEKITSINTNELSVSSGERKELTAVWNPDVAPGGYNAIANIDYDGNNIKIEKKFNIGPEEFGVLGVSVNDFRLGDVAKIRILVQNKLSDSVPNTFANLKVYDSNLKNLVNLKSENYDIPALSNQEMVVYWDTENLEKGQYGSELKIDYNDKFVSKNFKIDVSETSMSFSGVGFVIADGIQGKTSMTTILVIVIGALVLINLSWLIWWIRHRKKR